MAGTTRAIASVQSTPTQRLSLSDAIKGGKKLPTRLVFHGQPGIGKTSFAAHAPNPFFLLSPGETGLHTLIDSGLLPEIPNLEIPNWESGMGVIEELTTTEHPYKMLVVDVADGIEKLANEKVCQAEFAGDWSPKGFMNYQAGYRVTAAGPWRLFLSALDKLRETKRMGIILLAHTVISNFSNPEGPDYNRWVPGMYKDAWQLTSAWADIVLYGYREVRVDKDKTDRKAKASGGDIRLMATEWSAVADAKNRHNLPPTIDMGISGAEAWRNLVTAIKQGKAGA